MSGKKSVKPGAKKSTKSKVAQVNILDKYRIATELDFQMNASYLVVEPRGGQPIETWPGENDGLAKQAVKYSSLVARNQVLIKK